MTSSVFRIVGIFVLLTIAFGPTRRLPAAESVPAVTLESLLEEMLDRAAAARLPEPTFVLKQASSHDRRKNDPANAATWHSNVDYGQFLRTEVNAGRQEWVILEDQGPGAIVRFWTPLLAEKDQQTIRFYLDGSPTPAIVAKLNDLLGGNHPGARPEIAGLDGETEIEWQPLQLGMVDEVTKSLDSPKPSVVSPKA